MSQPTAWRCWSSASRGLGGLRRFAAVCATIIVADGLGVWMVSPRTPTPRALRAIFGLFGFLL